MTKLSKEEVLEILEQYPTETRVNHTTPNCSGSSKSMIIKRFSNGSAYVKCYRCHAWGKYNPSPYSTLKSKLSTRFCDGDSKESINSPALPPDCISNIDGWPPKARLWATKHISRADIEREGWVYNPDSRRVGITVYGDDKELIYYSERKIYDTPGAKYLTQQNKDTILLFGDRHKDTLVIVEDVISGIKVGTLFPTLVLTTTNLQPHQLHFILKEGYKRFKIFLDDDNAMVKQHALKIKKTLDKIGDIDVIHSEGKDPKEYSLMELEDLLNG